MALDFLDIIDVELARGLRCIDRACMVAWDLRENEARIPRNDRQRVLKSVHRALAIRAAIEAAGVRLPPLKVAEDPPKEIVLEDSNTWTISEIAKAAGVHRITVSRWLEVMDGAAGERYREARQQGRKALFTFQEAERILGIGGK